MIGSVLEGKCRIVRLIGEGGMGVVYEAEHTPIGRPVAVKLLHGEYARDADVVQRFIREARAATAIRHANIIDVTDMGTAVAPSRRTAAKSSTPAVRVGRSGFGP